MHYVCVGMGVCERVYPWLLAVAFSCFSVMEIKCLFNMINVLHINELNSRICVQSSSALFSLPLPLSLINNELATPERVL